MLIAYTTRVYLLSYKDMSVMYVRLSNVLKEKTIKREKFTYMASLYAHMLSAKRFDVCACARKLRNNEVDLCLNELVYP